MKAADIIYGIFIGLMVTLAVLLVVSKLPIPGNYKVLAVLSGSMEPAIHTGSVVVIAPASEYNVDDVITFGEMSKTKVPVTHRIKDIRVADGKTVFITQGDANNAPDSKEVMPSEIIGRELFTVPFAGFVLDFIRKPIGFAVIIVLPALMVIFDELRKIWREVRKNYEFKKIEN